jgi:hypothetical protein
MASADHKRHGATRRLSTTIGQDSRTRRRGRFGFMAAEGITV